MDITPFLIRIKQLERLLQDTSHLLAAKVPDDCPLLFQINAALDDRELPL